MQKKGSDEKMHRKETGLLKVSILSQKIDEEEDETKQNREDGERAAGLKRAYVNSCA